MRAWMGASASTTTSAEVGLEVGVALALVARLDDGDRLAAERRVDVEQVGERRLVGAARDLGARSR